MVFKSVETTINKDKPILNLEGSQIKCPQDDSLRQSSMSLAILLEAKVLER